MQIANYTVYSDNPYHRMLYADPRYSFVKSHIDDAIAQLKKAKKGIFHVHWEEHLLRKSLSEAEANAQVTYFLNRLNGYKANNGKIVLTIHNFEPHELNSVNEFHRLRKGVIDLADRVFVHNMESAAQIGARYETGLSKLYYLPHPSYLEMYEPVETTQERLATRVQTASGFLCFGKLRRYKAIDKMLEAWISQPPGLNMRIVGNGIPGDVYVDSVKDLVAAAPNVVLDEQHVPDEDVPAVVSSARAVVLPYERFLTSGVLLAAITFGVPVIAPNNRGIREILPRETHDFLYEKGNYADCFEKMRALDSLPQNVYEELCFACYQRADDFRPEKISNMKSDLFDMLLKEK